MELRMLFRIIALLAFIPAFAAAQIQDQPAARGLNGMQLLCVRNDGALTTMTSADADWSNCVTDSKGRMFVALDTASGVYAEDVNFPTGGSLSMAGAVNNRGFATTYNSSAGDATPISVGDKGGVATMLMYDSSMSGAVSPMVPEDSNVPDLQTLVMMGGVNNRSFAAYNSTNADATPFMVGDKGVQGSMLMYDSSLAGGSSPVVPEDTGMSTGQALVVSGTLMQDPLTIDAASNDAGYNKTDLAGRTIVTTAPSSERWRGCSSAATGTSNTAIKALVASNKICATSLSCYNTASVASAISFKSNTTQIYAGGISNSTLTGVAYWEHTLPTPVCTAVGEALNFAMLTTATNTVCCGAGFITVD